MSRKKQKMLTTKVDIAAWLKEHYIFNAHIVEEKTGFVVNTNLDIFLSQRDLNFLPFKFGIVKGHFFVPSNNLISLNNCPSFVGGEFNCAHNRLTSLIGSPSSVGSNYLCNNNQLTSLEGIPTIINGHFIASKNQINTARFCPLKTSGVFLLNDNPISFSTPSLNDNEFKNFLKLHKEEKKAFKEKEILAKAIKSNQGFIKTNKI